MADVPASAVDQLPYSDFNGSVAVYGPLLQDVVRTSDVLCGMLLFVTTVVLTVRFARLHWSYNTSRSACSQLVDEVHVSQDSHAVRGREALHVGHKEMVVVRA